MSEDFFGDLGRSISKAANEVVDKTGEFFESTKIRAQISGEEKVMEKAYRDIGEMIYRQHMEGQPVSEEVEKLCEDILSHEDKIKSFKSELASLKGQKLCPGCDEVLDKNASFCTRCGNSVVVEAEEEDEKSDIIETVESAAEEAKETVQNTVEEVVTEAKDAAGDVASEVRDKAEEVKSDLEG